MNSERKDWLRRAFDNLGTISDIAYDLRYLASALRKTGNTSMAETLGSYSAELLVAEKALRHAVGDAVSEQCQASEQALQSTTLAALAMCDVIPRREAARLIKRTGGKIGSNSSMV